MNKSQINAFTVKDEFELIYSATDYSLKRDESGWISGYFYHCEWTSVFQPIFNIDQSKTTEHAAYIRSKAKEDAAFLPWQVFSLASNDNQLINRLCRTIHALNYYFNNTLKSDKLFVNVHPRLLESVNDDHGRTFENFLDLIGVRTSRIMIEILGIVNHNRQLLQHVITNYRFRGYLIAAAYKGTSSDWMVELGGLYPNIVRIEADDLIRHEGIVLLMNTIHTFGANLLVKGIETTKQLASAIQAGANYLQGDTVGEPTRIFNIINSLPIIEKINSPIPRRP